ncbi:MAG TPA: hypothetical protein VGS20_08020 [Candidatus Acidoferrales bacterium]|nr:hypothetical protein [Candidatus Acidoferrales bacterium]
MKLKLVLVAVTFGALAIGHAGAAYAAPPKPACSLLTPAQVGAVLGGSVEAGKAFTAKVCIWRGAPGKRATLNLIGTQRFVYAKTPVGNGVAKTEVKGIGDDAVYVSTHGAPTTLTVKKGDDAFTLTVFGFSDDLTKAKERELALEICSKL